MQLTINPEKSPKSFLFLMISLFHNLIYFSLFLACQTAVHKKCHDKLLGTCSESSFNSESTIVSLLIEKAFN